MVVHLLNPDVGGLAPINKLIFASSRHIPLAFQTQARGQDGIQLGLEAHPWPVFGLLRKLQNALLYYVKFARVASTQLFN